MEFLGIDRKVKSRLVPGDSNTSKKNCVNNAGLFWQGKQPSFTLMSHHDHRDHQPGGCGHHGWLHVHGDGGGGAAVRPHLRQDPRDLQAAEAGA